MRPLPVEAWATPSGRRAHFLTPPNRPSIELLRSWPPRRTQRNRGSGPPRGRTNRRGCLSGDVWPSAGDRQARTAKVPTAAIWGWRLALTPSRFGAYWRWAGRPVGTRAWAPLLSRARAPPGRAWQFALRTVRAHCEICGDEGTRPVRGHREVAFETEVDASERAPGPQLRTGSGPGWRRGRQGAGRTSRRRRPHLPQRARSRAKGKRDCSRHPFCSRPRAIQSKWRAGRDSKSPEKESERGACGASHAPENGAVARPTFVMRPGMEHIVATISTAYASRHRRRIHARG